MNEIKAIALLKELIRTPSFSKEEDKTASVLQQRMEAEGIAAMRHGNNVWARSDNYDERKPTILLNSHHDTVKPNGGWNSDPFEPVIDDGKLIGLGGNDAGGALVCLLASYLQLQKRDLPVNLVFAATAEEEISGYNGIESIIDKIGNVDIAIVGEPTQMKLAVAEKGLMVLDCMARGKSGHAAREEGINAITRAMKDIEWFRSYRFVKESDMLGQVKMNVTAIEAGDQHNVVPDICKFVVDVRTTDCYTNKEVLEIIQSRVSCEVNPRSTRLQPSGLAELHPVIKVAKTLGMHVYGSLTTSDQAVIPWDSVKIGPGDSGRSHTANEFIYLKEIKQGIAGYMHLIKELANQLTNGKDENKHNSLG